LTKPTVTGTTHTLPFEALSPRNFERLCLWLVEREGYERAEHLGAAGSEQGRDIVAWQEDELWAFQCKRVKTFGPSDALKEVEKVLGLPDGQRPVGLVYLVTCDVSANTRQQVRDRCQEEMACQFWAGTELDAMVERHPEILNEFFQVANSSPKYNIHIEHAEGIAIGDHAQVVQSQKGAKDRAPQVDLQACERRYRDRIRERFAEEAGYYIELAGETAEPLPPHDEPRAPRSARRRRQRAMVEYHRWIETERGIQKVRLDTLRQGVERYPCIVLLGDPGSGKTTALENLAYQYADEPDRLPVLLRLSEFGPGLSLEGFIDQGWGGSVDAGHWGAPHLAANLEQYLAQGKLLLLFDALNEMPRQGHEGRTHALRRFIDRWASKGNRFLFTCRVLDYGEELSGLQRVEVQPLDDGQIQAFLDKELPEDGPALWGVLTEEGDEQHRLLEMARNPYLLTIMIDVFAEDGQLGRNRAELMGRSTQILLEWAKAKCPRGEWLDADLLREALSVLAYEAQDRAGFGTMIGTQQVVAVMPRQIQLDPRWPPVPTPPEQVLSLAASANILEMPVDRSTVHFYHQLLQEYFAARELCKRIIAGESLSHYVSLESGKLSGWEETFTLLGGMEPEASSIAKMLVELLTDDTASPIMRCQIGDHLARLDDPRPGVGLRDDGLPDIAWCEVPTGPFIMGEADNQHLVNLPRFRISLYPVTIAQYDAFKQDEGYTEKWRDCWMEASWQWKYPSRPDRYGGAFDLPNHPVVGVTWYEALAYCCWLTARLLAVGDLEEGWQVTLPSEAQWEKAARGTDGRRYPWGDDPDLNRANYQETEIDATSAVGCFPSGASPYGCFDMAGNVWEWTRSSDKDYPYDPDDGRENLEAPDSVLRVGRGGSFYHLQVYAQCAARLRSNPSNFLRDGGFRVVVSPIS
jgi:formylglycine-generating enzyme required for sulfatase activity